MSKDGQRIVSGTPLPSMPVPPPPPPAGGVPAGDGPQFAAVQTLWFTPRDLRRFARKGGVTVKAQVTGEALWLEWQYGVPKDAEP